MNGLTNFQSEAIKAALTAMFEKGWFDICTIDSVLKVTGGIPSKKDYEALRLLHCVHFRDMPTKLRLELPRVLQLVVESQPMCYPPMGVVQLEIK